MGGIAGGVLVGAAVVGEEVSGDGLEVGGAVLLVVTTLLSELSVVETDPGGTKDEEGSKDNGVDEVSGSPSSEDEDDGDDGGNDGDEGNPVQFVDQGLVDNVVDEIEVKVSAGIEDVIDDDNAEGTEDGVGESQQSSDGSFTWGSDVGGISGIGEEDELDEQGGGQDWEQVVNGAPVAVVLLEVLVPGSVEDNKEGGGEGDNTGNNGNGEGGECASEVGVLDFSIWGGEEESSSGSSPVDEDKTGNQGDDTSNKHLPDSIVGIVAQPDGGANDVEDREDDRHNLGEGDVPGVGSLFFIGPFGKEPL